MAQSVSPGRDCRPEGGEHRSLAACVEEKFLLPEQQTGQLSPLVLAYIGDAVYEIVVRTILVRRHNEAVSRLHHEASALVNAGTQSAMMDVIEPLLTQEEDAVYHRGRNAKSSTRAKNAGIVEYRRATGFEALMGFLYLEGRYERMTDLIARGISGTGRGDAANRTR